MSAWVWVIIVLGAIAIAGILLAAYFSRRRRSQVRERFGPEYERTVHREGGTRGAVKELKERESRLDRLDIRPLDSESAERYRKGWTDAQARFVDRPQVALAEADQLIIAVMRERGYPMDDFDQRADDLSVDHPEVVAHYRVAHATSEKSENGPVDTEEMRRAMVHYRALFEVLVEPVDDQSADNRRTVRLDEEERTRAQR